MENSNEQDETEIIPIKELRSQPLKSALKSCIVSKVGQKYQIIALRALVNENSELWNTRRKLEEILNNDTHIVGFISSGTALKQTTNGKSENKAGISFWIIFDWPDYGLNVFESYVSKLFIKQDCNLYGCKAVKGRSKFA